MDHVFGGMLFDLCGGHRGWAFAQEVAVVQLPQVAILMQSPWSLWLCCFCGKLVHIFLLIEEGLTVSGHMYGLSAAMATMPPASSILVDDPPMPGT